MLQITTLLDRTADTVLDLHCRTQIREQEEPDLGDRHLLQARRPAEHRLHFYVDHKQRSTGTHYLSVIPLIIL